MKESTEALKGYGYTHVFGSIDTKGAFSVWQKRDIILVRDDRTGEVLASVALDSYGRAERISQALAKAQGASPDRNAGIDK